MEIKICKKCGEELPLSAFGNVKGKNNIVYKNGTCKKCTAEYKRGYHQENKEKEYERQKERRKVNHSADLKKYAENKDVLNEKRREKYTENKDKINEDRREKRNDNKDKINAQKRAWYARNKEGIQQGIREKYKTDKEFADKVKQRAGKWYGENKESANLRYHSYYLNNTDQVKDLNRRYRKTEKGKLVRAKMRANRRKLGFNPINRPFENSVYHHLRYTDETGNIDNSIGLYIPDKLHKSIMHNGNTGRNMNRINKVALEWYVSSTPKISSPEKVFKLLQYYSKF